MTQTTSQNGSWERCDTVNANASTGVVLVLAQDNTAVKLQAAKYAEIDAAKACATPVGVSYDL